jgi:RNA polymerase sigma factor (sigma-70 family)
MSAPPTLQDRFRDYLANTLTPLILGVCQTRLRDANEVEDAVQETLWRIWRQYRENELHLNDPTGQRNWYIGIAVNVCREMQRRQRRESSLSDDISESLESRVQSSHDELEGREQGEVINSALERLRVEYQEVLTLHYWAKLRVEDIAEVLSEPVGTVKTWLRRARTELLGLLPAELVESPSHTGEQR